MTAYNYRFYPAICLAEELIDAGELGEIYHFRGRYQEDHGPQFGCGLDKSVAPAPSGSQCARIDQSRYLVGNRSDGAPTFIKEPGRTVDVDDAFEATVSSRTAIGTYEAPVRAGANQMRWEINGLAIA
jgi:predicted dehydrogenase